MPDPYRDELAPLRTQLSALRAEAAEIDSRLGRADEMKKRRAEVATELDELESRLRNLETQSTLDGLRIASPCKASWDDMVGDDRVRFCGLCAKNVFNVSGMTRDEAYTLLRASQNESVCMRLYKRADGTVITADCPEGAKKKRVRRLALVAGGLAAAAAGGAFLTLSGARTMGEIEVAGGIRVGEQAPEPEPVPLQGQPLMGDVAPVGSVFVPPPDAPPPIAPKGKATGMSQIRK